MLAYAEKMKDILFILVVTAIFSAIAHTVGSNGNLAAASIGSLFLVVIALIGIVLSQLPVLKKLPMVFWVSAVAVVGFVAYERRGIFVDHDADFGLRWFMLGQGS